MIDICNDALTEDYFDTVLSPDFDFCGVINFEKSFLVRGKVSGEISSQGTLLIDEGSIVDADITAERIIIRGSVVGNIKAAARLEISSTGKLEGNIQAPEINFEMGCIFNGKCVMK
jgi:cytoskeletal protein CcmA (bactofilin family)